MAEKMRVVMLEPEVEAYEAEIDGSLKGMQKIVGGHIEPFFVLGKDACIIVNEEGKLRGLPINREIYSEGGRYLDTVVGTAFICGLGLADFCSLTDDQIEEYKDRFRRPLFE